MRKTKNAPVDPLVERQKLQAEFEERISLLFGQCLENLMVLANGELAEGSGCEGAAKKYERPPDRAANEYIINRILGRPASRRPIPDPPPPPPVRVDLSKIPQDRLDTMERWLSEGEVQTNGSGHALSDTDSEWEA